jgi:hypothetical protein
MGRVINLAFSGNSRAKPFGLGPTPFLPGLNFSRLSALENLPAGKSFPPCLHAYLAAVTWL